MMDQDKDLLVRNIELSVIMHKTLELSKVEGLPECRVLILLTKF